MVFFGKKEITLKDIKDLYLKDQIKKAISLCEDYLKKNRNDFDAMNLLVEMYYKIGEKTKVINLILDLVKKLESEKYYEKAAAVLRKGIKYYPDFCDFYRYLAKIFAAKGLTADQINALKELANVYEKSGDIDKFFNVLFDIFEIDRSNYSFIKYFVDKLKSYKRNKEICKILSEAIESAKQNNDKAFLAQLIDDGIENRCVFGKSIKYTIDYFRKHTEKIPIFVKYAGDYLVQEFDDELFLEVQKILPFENNKDFYLDIYKKHMAPSIFEFFFPKFLKDENIAEISNMINRLKEIGNLDKRYGDVIECYIDKLPIDKLYDDLLVVAKSSNNDQLKSKIISLVGSKEEYVKPKTHSVLNLDLLDTDKNVRPLEQIDNLGLFEQTSYSDQSSGAKEIEIDISNSNDFEIDLDLSDFSDLDKKNDVNSHKDIDEKGGSEGEDVLEIDLTEHADNQNVNSLSDLSGGDLPDITLDFFNDVDHKVIPERQIKVDFGKEIDEIEKMIQDKKYEYSRAKIEELLLLDPENERLKDLATKIYSISLFDEKDEDKKVADIVDFDPETRKVVKSIRDSIEKTVSHDDYEMHYDLALAYMEMDLLEEAIEELKKSSYGKFRYKSLALMVECYKRMKKFTEAIDILKLIMMDYGNDNEILKNTLFDLGSLYELKGDISSAQSYFLKLYNIDPEFRNINEKVNASDLGSENLEDVGSSDKSGKKKKISFM
jgi:tetratricopeptide (TPR) repeat protein